MSQLNIFLPPFYNTIQATNPELRAYEDAATTQQERVLAYFSRIGRATALQAADALGMHESSCRRCVTNLTKEGKLIKTAEMKIDRYQKPNHIYQYSI